MVSGQVLRFFRVTFFDLHCSITTFIRHLDFMLRVHFTQLTSLLCMMPYDLVSQDEASLVGVTVAAAAAPTAAGPAGAVAAAGEGGQSQQESKGEGGGGGGGSVNGSSSSSSQGGQSQQQGQEQLQPQVLVLTKAEGGINDIHNLMVLRHLETLTKNPALRALLAKLLSSSTLSSSAAAAAAAAADGGGEEGWGRADDRSRQFQCLRILVHQQVCLMGREEGREGKRDKKRQG